MHVHPPRFALLLGQGRRYRYSAHQRSHRWHVRPQAYSADFGLLRALVGTATVHRAATASLPAFCVAIDPILANARKVGWSADWNSATCCLLTFLACCIHPLRDVDLFAPVRTRTAFLALLPHASLDAATRRNFRFL